MKGNQKAGFRFVQSDNAMKEKRVVSGDFVFSFLKKKKSLFILHEQDAQYPRPACDIWRPPFPAFDQCKLRHWSHFQRNSWYGEKSNFNFQNHMLRKLFCLLLVVVVALPLPQQLFLSMFLLNLCIVSISTHTHTHTHTPFSKTTLFELAQMVTKIQQ